MNYSQLCIDKYLFIESYTLLYILGEYHVIRAQAETCYGQEIGENKTKLLRVCHLLRPGPIQEIHDTG